MTNEELAIQAKMHKDWAVLELWENVRRFVVVQARKYELLHDKANGQELEDLIQDGFLAMLDAVEKYEPERGMKFLTFMAYYLKKRFAEAYGLRSSSERFQTRNADALRISSSIDTPLKSDDIDAGTISDVIEDSAAEYAFLIVDYNDFIQYVHRLELAALETLTPVQKQAINEHYLQWKAIKDITGSSTQSISQNIERGLRHLKRGKYTRELLDALHGFNDFREYDSNSWLSRRRY